MRLYAACALYRIVNALVIRTAFSPDEYWQSLEVAHRIVFGCAFTYSASPEHFLPMLHLGTTTADGDAISTTACAPRVTVLAVPQVRALDLGVGSRPARSCAPVTVRGALPAAAAGGLGHHGSGGGCPEGRAGPAGGRRRRGGPRRSEAALRPLGRQVRDARHASPYTPRSGAQHSRITSPTVRHCNSEGRLSCCAGGRWSAN